MLPLREVLVAVDRSEASAAATRVASGLTARFGGRLRLVHVEVTGRGGRTIPGDARYLGAADDRARWDARCHARLTLGGRDEARVQIRRGEGAASEIVAAARDVGADLVVVGTNGRAGLRRVVLGSVAEAVMRTAPCPVLTVKQRPSWATDEAFASGERVAMPLRRILVGTDLFDAARRGEEMAAALAGATGAELHLAHVIEEGSRRAGGLAPPGLISEAREALSAVASRVRRAIFEAAEASGSGEPPIPVEHVHQGSAAVEIERLIDAIDPDLVVLATHGRTGLSRLALGSTAESVARSAACPVLSVRLEGSYSPEP